MEGTMKAMPRVERPREKLIQYGPEKLSNAELLAILLRSGKKGEHVVAMAKRILQTVSLAKIPHTPFAELRKIAGLGPAKACEVVACFELGKRLLKEKQYVLLMSPEDVWRQMKDIRDNKKEHFVIFYLDARQQEIKRDIISVGTLTNALVHPREVFEPAIRHVAAQVIISHNHPSGSLLPSEADKLLTERLQAAGRILGIQLIDHVIVTKKSWMSFREESLLE